MTQPFLKWAGGKSRLVADIAAVLPPAGRLVEPFLGSAAVFLGLDDRFQRHLLADANPDLIGLYRQLRDDPRGFVADVQALFTPEANTEAVFMDRRARFNSLPPGSEERCRLFIWLNRHCFNGLYRVNRAGQFNVAFGRYDTPHCPTEAMLAFAERADKAELACQDFRETMAQARAGDVVYCDPPYSPRPDQGSNFNRYWGAWTASDLVDLVAAARVATDHGATVVISDHDTPVTRSLFADAETVELAVHRSISRDGSGRRAVPELLAVFRPERRTLVPAAAVAANDDKEVPPAAMFSFFAGSGFLDLGFERAGYRTALAVEHNNRFAAAYTYARERMGEPLPGHGVVVASVEEYLGTRSEELRRQVAAARAAYSKVGFIGGPPCPDFSVAGNNAGHQGKNGRLTGVYVDLICQQQPDWFLFENVKGLVSTARHREHFEALKGQLRAAGYELAETLADARQYGVPQYRERVILVGFSSASFGAAAVSLAAGFVEHLEGRALWSREELDSAPWPGAETFMERSVRPYPAELPGEMAILSPSWWWEQNAVDSHPNADQCLVPKSAKMWTTPEGQVSGMSCKRLHRWRYSPTAAYGNNEVHLHPWLPRRLTVAEALAIQSLPAEFVLPPDMPLTAAFKTVGNGVPYLLALATARAIADSLALADQGEGRLAA